MPRTPAALLVALAVLTWASPAAAQDHDRAGSAPAATRLSRADLRAFAAARRIADRTRTVRRLRRSYPDLVTQNFRRSGSKLELVYASPRARRDLAAISVDLAKGEATGEWTGDRIAWTLARGRDGPFGGATTARWWFWVPLGLLFLAPFVDPRRPLRLLHLDLLALLAFGVSHVLFNHGNLDASVPLVYPVLGYLLVRMLLAGFGRGGWSGPLVPYARTSWLVAGIAVLAVARIVVDVLEHNVLDVGYAGVIGADHIVHGEGVYGPGFAADPPNGDTYGPVTYLAYVPFRLLFGWSGHWDSLPAAHAAAIVFDLLVLGALFGLGRRLRGRELGVALAYAWVAFPYSAYVLWWNSNDALVALAVVLAIYALASPVRRGLWIGLGGAAKFAPLFLAPLFARVRDEGWRLRPMLVFGATVLAVLLVTIVPLLPPGGVSEFYDRTLGFQVGRSSPLSIWDQHPSLDTLHLLVKIAAVDLAVLLLLLPARRSAAQVAALSAAVLIALQLGSTYWLYLYVVWFAPLVLVAAFANSGEAPAGAAGVSRQTASSPRITRTSR